jgi:hypothetical protein
VILFKEGGMEKGREGGREGGRTYLSDVATGGFSEDGVEARLHGLGPFAGVALWGGGGEGGTEGMRGGSEGKNWGREGRTLKEGYLMARNSSKASACIIRAAALTRSAGEKTEEGGGRKS